MPKAPSTASSIDVSFLGTGDAFASGGRLQSGYLLTANNYRVLMEAGPTVLPALKRSRIPPEDIDLILISHLHGDHFGGLPFLILNYLWENPPSKPNTIAGPKHLEERTWRLFRTMFPNSGADAERVRRQLRFVVLEPGDNRRLGRIRVAAIRTPHMRREASLALKLTFDGKTIVFSGDSGWTEDLVAFAAGADLFMCECTYFESSHLDFHMNYPELQRQRSRFDVGRMILTHVGREVLGHQHELNIETASDGMTLQV